MDNVNEGYKALLNDGWTMEEIEGLSVEEFGAESIRAMLKEAKQEYHESYNY
jgi:hypothetical protein